MYVLSSYADRCHMSAQLLLAGLYKPVRNQIWNSDLLWQPIPVHELPRNLDNVRFILPGNHIDNRNFRKSL